MGKRIIITETQFQNLKHRLTETVHAIAVEKLKNELDNNYKVMNTYVRDNGDYRNNAMIQKLADEELITPNELLTYLRSKYKEEYNAKDPWIIQVIKDWADNKIGDDFTLSKNVTLT